MPFEKGNVFGKQICVRRLANVSTHVYVQFQPVASNTRRNYVFLRVALDILV